MRVHRVQQFSAKYTRLNTGRRTVGLFRAPQGPAATSTRSTKAASNDRHQQPLIQQDNNEISPGPAETSSERETDYINNVDSAAPILEQEQIVVTTGLLGRVQHTIEKSPAIRIATFAAAGFLGVTFLVALIRTGMKLASPEAKRGRTINKNKLVVDEIRKYLPGNRAALGGGTIGRLRLQTGYSPVEIFRKYLWFLLRERKFDQEAVDDLVALKNALGLSDEEAAEAVRERAQRIYNKYGNVMLETEGMTKAGIERKATTRALFSKLQYLLDYEPLMAAEASVKVSLRDIFGATEQDVARLQIISLHEVDLEAAAAMPSAAEPEEKQQNN